MSDAAETEETEPEKKSKKPMLIGLILCLLGAGGGFYATWSGMILGPSDPAAERTTDDKPQAIPDIVFVKVDPLLVPLPNGANNSVLRFRSNLEVPSVYQSDVELLMPRVIDVLNSYLRALSAADIENPSALSRIRAQMLRRVQIVVGKGRVNDLLIMEFVLN